MSEKIFSRYSGPEIFFIIVSSLALVLGNFEFKRLLYYPYLIILVTSLVACPLFLGTIRELSPVFVVFFAGALLYLSFELFFGNLAGLGGSDWIFFIRAIPFLFLGILLGKDIKLMSKVLALNMIFLGLVSIKIIATVDFDFVSREGLAISLIGDAEIVRIIGGGAGDILDDFIMFFPYMTFSLIPLPLVLRDLDKPWKISTILSAVIIALALFLSTWTAPILITLIWITLYAITSGVLFTPKYLILSALFLVILAGFYFAASILLTVDVDERFRVFQRVNNIIGALFSGHFFDVVNENSGGRWNLNLLSLKSFLESPLFGTTLSGGFAPVGGHSAIFDNLARYGIIGSTFILGVVFVPLVHAVRWFKRAKREPVFQLALVYLVTLIIGCFFNPYLGTSYIDQMTFVVIGCLYARIASLKRRQPVPYEAWIRKGRYRKKERSGWRAAQTG